MGGRCSAAVQQRGWATDAPSPSRRSLKGCLVNRSTASRLLGASLVAGAVLALANHAAARRAERRNPPRGRFITVDGVRLHYTDRGGGPAVVLIHGNVVTGSDWEDSGLVEALLRHHRVIAFDRPGFGHSDRPRDRIWTAERQADLLHMALRRLGVARPVVVGHSWGAGVALAMAARHPQDVAGLVLLSGYYHWTLRPDVALVAPVALPLLGDVLRYTLSPLLGRLLMPLLKRGMFGPAPVPPRFRAGFSDAMALRPSQIRAIAEDGTLMIPAALRLRRAYARLTMPVAILAGEGDRVVFARNARRLHASIPGSTLRILPGVGHMLHHMAPEAVVRAVEEVSAAARPGSRLGSRPGGQPGAEMVATPRAA